MRECEEVTECERERKEGEGGENEPGDRVRGLTSYILTIVPIESWP